MSKKKAIIIGAGPAGLTAAYELLQRTDIEPVIIEADSLVGGISKTVNYKGNRIDIGGHRFFSKSDRVMKWWLSILPRQRAQGVPPESSADSLEESYYQYSSCGPDPELEDKVMLVRHRLSRILFEKSLYDYPLKLNGKTMMQLGLPRMMKLGLSYLKAKICPIKEEKSLEDFIINRFGRELYQTFFQSYTEKVWGIPCNKIDAQWGSQRIKGLSIYRALLHAVSKMFKADASQRKTETSLIDRFLYPKFGPGQLWEEVAECCRLLRGEVLLNHRAVSLELCQNRIASVSAASPDGGVRRFEGDYFFSSMPISHLMAALGPVVPGEVASIAAQLPYRDFMTLGMLLKPSRASKIRSKITSMPDNWIYVQEAGVKVGRIQLFHNWSKYLVADKENLWVGRDDFWNADDRQLIDLAKQELLALGLAQKDEIIDSTVIRCPKAYPAYTGSYRSFSKVRDYLDTIENLYPIGRNGQHRYNNQDHSMLTAMTAVDGIVNGCGSKEDLWKVNADTEYHESANSS